MIYMIQILKLKVKLNQRSKSLVNNNPIESLNLNVNTKNKQHSPKQISDIFNKKSTINKINYKNIDKKRKKLNLNKDKETEHLYNKNNYLSNESTINIFYLFINLFLKTKNI